MNKKILNLAIPNIISNITVPLLGVVDLALLGHLENDNYIGAMALGTMIFNFIYWALAFLRISTSGFTAQAYGGRKLQESILILSRGITVGVIISLILVSLQWPIAKLSFYIIDGNQEVEKLALEYFYIRIYAAPASISLFAISGWFIGMQNSKSPMIVAIMINILNIVFNLFFIYGLGMKSNGVALGTVLAQYSGLILSLFFIYRYYRRLFKYWSYKLMIQVKALKQFFTVNTDIFLRMICIITVFSFFTTQSANKDANQNEAILAANSLLLQFLMLYSYLADGFAFAAEALIGRYVGAKSPKNVKKVIKLIFMWSGGIGVLFTFVYGLGGEAIVSLLTDNQKIIDTAKPYLFWMGFIPLVTLGAFVWDGIYVGATASRGMLISVFISTFVVYLPVYYIFRSSLGNHSLWLAMILFSASRGIIQTAMARKAIFKKLKV